MLFELRELDLLFLPDFSTGLHINFRENRLYTRSHVKYSIILYTTYILIRWSFFLNSEWCSKERTIKKTHPTLKDTQSCMDPGLIQEYVWMGPNCVRSPLPVGRPVTGSTVPSGKKVCFNSFSYRANLSHWPHSAYLHPRSHFSVSSKIPKQLRHNLVVL